MPVYLTRYEMARVVGLRALQLDAGATPLVTIEADSLRCDSSYVAALELATHRLDARVQRGDGSQVDVRTARMPPELNILLDGKDGGVRGVFMEPHRP